MSNIVYMCQLNCRQIHCCVDLCGLLRGTGARWVYTIYYSVVYSIYTHYTHNLTIGQRAFCHSSPSIWNSIPLSVRDHQHIQASSEIILF